MQRYNAVATAVMREAGVPVHNLYGLIKKAGTALLQNADGTHYGTADYELLAAAVADCVQRQWLQAGR